MQPAVGLYITIELYSDYIYSLSRTGPERENNCDVIIWLFWHIHHAAAACCCVCVCGVMLLLIMLQLLFIIFMRSASLLLRVLRMPYTEDDGSKKLRRKYVPLGYLSVSFFFRDKLACVLVRFLFRRKSSEDLILDALMPSCGWEPMGRNPQNPAQNQ